MECFSGAVHRIHVCWESSQLKAWSERPGRGHVRAQPAGIALDPAGDIYVSDSGNCRVQIWEPNVGVGVPVAGGQGLGSEVDQLNWPRGIMRRGNTLYVADTGNARIMAWDLA